MNAVSGVTGYPVIRLMTLAETGTRALIGAVFGTTAIGELAWARRLLHLLDGSMLVLMDRGFDAGDFLAEVAATGAQFLVRLNATRRPPVLARLPDGSCTSVIGGVKVRVIAASVTITCHDGTRYGGEYRLATSLLDHRACPAGALISIYHERWEHETVYLALRHTLLRGRILRSGDPAGLEQEMWALLVYQALRTAVTDAVQAIAGTDPDRASYQVAVQAAQNLVTTARNITGPGDDLKGGIGRGPGQPEPAPAAPRLPPPRQVPAQPLEQAPTRQTHHQQADHQHQHRNRPHRQKTRNTPHLKTSRTAGGRRDMHAQLSPERQADTTGLRGPLSAARPSSRPRPWPSVQSRRSPAPLPGPDSRPLYVRGQRNIGAYSVTR
jgi:Transposase DDE domain